METEEVKSTHRVEIVPVLLEPHGNADNLSVVRVFDYQVVVRSLDWAGRSTGAYIPPDSIVPDTPEYEFLKGHRRIKARRLRGEWSVGMLVPAPDNAKLGDDVADQLGIIHYDPPEPGATMGSQRVVKPPLTLYGTTYPNYDLDDFRRYSRHFIDGEPVYITEKIHGANGRWLWDGDEFHCGSKKEWKECDPGNLWWKVLAESDPLKTFLKQHPLTCVYGEVYGTQSLKYGCPKGEAKIALFDILRATPLGYYSPLEFQAAVREFNLPSVPVLVMDQSFNKDIILAMADGPSLISTAHHHREGIVVQPIVNRPNGHYQSRLKLKIVSYGYLEKEAA